MPILAILKRWASGKPSAPAVAATTTVAPAPQNVTTTTASQPASSGASSNAQHHQPYATHYCPQGTLGDDTTSDEDENGRATDFYPPPTPQNRAQDSYVMVEGEGLVHIPHVPLYDVNPEMAQPNSTYKNKDRLEYDLQREKNHFGDCVVKDDALYKDGKRYKCYSIKQHEQKQQQQLRLSPAPSTDSTILAFMRTNTPQVENNGSRPITPRATVVPPTPTVAEKRVQ